MTDMPPSRFRVVERGRRLEVIDTQAKRTPVRSPQLLELSRPSRDADRRPTWLPQRNRFDGGAVWTTRRFYDAKGPRTLTLDRGVVAQMRWAGLVLGLGVLGWLILASFVPVLLALPLLLASDKTRATLRDSVTDWIDRTEGRK